MSYLSEVVSPSNAFDDFEMDFLAQDVQSDIREIEYAAEESDRVAENAEVLMALHSPLSQVKRVSKAHIVGVDNILRAVTRGENVNPYDHVMSMESSEGGSYNTEGLRDFAMKIWKAVKNMIAKLWKKARAFYTKMNGAVAQLRRAVNKLRKRAEDAQSKSSDESDVEITSEVNALSRKGVLEKTGKQYLEGLEEYYSLSAGVLDEYIRKIASVGETLADNIDALEWDSEKEGMAGDNTNKLDSLIATLISVPTALYGTDVTTPTTALGDLKMTTTGLDNDKRYDEDMNAAGKQMLGNRLFVVSQRKYEASKPANAKLATIKIITSTRYEFASWSAKSKEVDDEGTVKTMTPGEVTDCCDKILAILSIIDRFNTGKQIDKIAKGRDKISDKMDKIAKQVDKLEKPGPDVMVAYNTMAQLSSVWTRWTTQPQASIEGAAVATARAIVSVGNKSMATYK